jgi:hypothetical protein
MTNGSLHVSSKAPPPPENADFALYINFKKGEGNPARVFQAADAMIRALQKLDHALCAAIDSQIEPVLVLEEIETGSLKIWLRDVLQAADDEALKALDWKPAVGKYLVRAKYIYIQWANKTDPNATLLGLARDLRAIAVETDARHIPAYSPPSIADLAEAAQQIDEAKGYLAPGDQISYLPAPGAASPDLGPIDFDLAMRWDPADLLRLAVKETTKHENMPLTLIVKRPDYLGNSMWDLRHGRTTISAKIAHADWLRRFQARSIDVRPGDALRCLVTIENSYGYDNELISTSYIVTNVQEVLENQLQQGDLLNPP